MSAIIWLISVHLLACLSPGPDSLLVMLNSSRRGLVSGLITTLGILTGVAIQVSLGIMGILTIFEQSGWAKTLATICGATYLIYIGVRGLIESLKVSSPHISGEEQEAQSTHLSAFSQGLITNILNPKAWLYFISLFAGVLGGHSHSLPNGGMALTVILSQSCAFSLLAFAFSRKSKKASGWKFQAKIPLLAGALLTALGIWILIQYFVK